MNPIQSLDYIVVHHSASPTTTTVADIRRWHVDDHGWDAIGYHWIMTGDGVIHRCRPIPMQGAHCLGWNDGSLGLCIVGDNTTLRQKWRYTQRASLIQFAAGCNLLFPGVPIVGHRDLKSGTDCPGVDVRKWMQGPR